MELRDIIAGYAALLSTILGLAKLRWPLIVVAPHITQHGPSDDAIEFRFYNPSRRPLQVSVVRFVPATLDRIV